MRLRLARPSASLGTRERERRLAAIAEVIERDEPEEALSRLEEFLVTFPDDKMAHILKASVHEMLEDYESCEQEISSLVKRYPDCPECHELWLSSAISSDMLAIAVQRANYCLKKWPKRPYFIKLADMMPDIEKEVLSDIEDLCSPPKNWLELAVKDDTAQFLERNFHFDEAIEICIKVLDTAPDYLPIRNTLASCRFDTGQIDEAKRDFERLLAVSRTPAVALGGLVRIAILQGRYDEAREMAVRMRTQCSPDWSNAVANSLCLAGDFDGMRAYYEELAATSEQLETVFKHCAATAYARLDITARAKELWKEVLKEEPDFSPATLNLSDMAEELGARSGPWSHTLEDYLPLALWHDIFIVLTGDPDLADESFETLKSEWPELRNVAPVVLERGDDLSRRMALSVLFSEGLAKNKDVLLRFASGRNGTDKVRAGVYYFMADAGMLPRENFTFWQNGKAHEIPLRELRSLRNVANITLDEDETLTAEAYSALTEGRYSEAVAGFTKALEHDPRSPVLRNNLAASYRGLGDAQKNIEIISDLYDDHPDYLFARTNMAHIQMDAGNFDAARGLLKPLSEQIDLRPSEYEAVYTALLSLASLENDHEGAEKWLSALEEAVPTSEMVASWKEVIINTADVGGSRSKAVKKRRNARTQKSRF